MSLSAVKDPKKEFDEVIKSIRLDLEKLKFDLQNFSVLLNAYYYYIK